MPEGSVSPEIEALYSTMVEIYGEDRAIELIKREQARRLAAAIRVAGKRRRKGARNLGEWLLGLRLEFFGRKRESRYSKGPAWLSDYRQGVSG